MVDTSLHTVLGKVIPEDIISILDSNLNGYPTSGIAVLLELQESNKVEENISFTHKTYRDLIAIKR